jgi:hypothetical protein
MKLPRLAIAAATIALLATAPSAQAGLLVESATDCPDLPVVRPFTPWLDPAKYVLAPEGTFETTDSWRLAGAARVAGNEPYQVNSTADRHSLALAPGGSARSATFCAGLEHPTVRLFARNTGSPLSLLKVEVLVRDRLRLLRALPIGLLAAGPSWQPTLPLLLVANLLPLLPGEKTPLALRFTAIGSGGEWQIDDVYIDPYRK